MKDFLMNASVRLRCNYADLPFCADRNEELARRVTERISVALERSGDAYAYLLPSGLQEEKRRVFTQKGLMHADTAEAPYSVLYLRMDEKASVQTALCDHAVISACSAAGDAQKCLQTARDIRRQLSSAGEIAHDENYGYLTAYPCDAGTGMRASFLLHLPMMIITHQAEKMLRMMSARGAILRPASGDVGKVYGGLYLLENRAALGKSAEEMLLNVQESVDKALEIEHSCREKARNSGDEMVLNAAWRAWGIARYAHCLNKQETLNLWSGLTLGVSIGAFELDETVLDGIWNAAFDRNMPSAAADEKSHPDILRARYVRSLFHGGN